MCLDALARHLAGEDDGAAPAGVSPAWLATYEGHVAAGMPSGAPVPGLDDARSG